MVTKLETNTGRDIFIGFNRNVRVSNVLSCAFACVKYEVSTS